MGALGFVPWKILAMRPRGNRGPTGLSIYALIDPRDMLIRYIGFTKRELHKRLEVHLARPVSKKMAEWFRSLKGDSPIIERICWTTEDRWERDEMYWIGWCRQLGYLLNVDAGGEYRLDAKHVNPSKKRMAKKVVRNMLRNLGIDAKSTIGTKYAAE